MKMLLATENKGGRMDAKEQIKFLLELLAHIAVAGAIVLNVVSK